jgi:hypothetical protein
MGLMLVPIMDFKFANTDPRRGQGFPRNLCRACLSKRTVFRRHRVVRKVNAGALGALSYARPQRCGY